MANPLPSFVLGAGASTSADTTFAFTGINGVQELPARPSSPQAQSHVELDRSAWRAAWAVHGRFYLGDEDAANGRVLTRATAGLRAEVLRLGEALSLAENAVTREQSALAGVQKEKDTARKLAAALLIENKLLSAQQEEEAKKKESKKSKSKGKAPTPSPSPSPTPTTTTTPTPTPTPTTTTMESIRDLPGEEAHDRGVMLERQVEQLEASNSRLKAHVQKLDQDMVEANRVRADSERELAEKKEKVEELSALVDKHRREVELEKKGSQNTSSLLDRAYADLHDAIEARKMALKARDEAEALHHELEGRFKDLHLDWEDSQDKIGQLEQQLEAIHALEIENAGLQHDMDNLVQQLADHDRTLIVKDERISNLETHLQKERQRNLEAQFRTDRQRDRIVTSGATSPIDEEPWTFNIDSVNESLADELSQASQLDDDSLYEPLNEFSEVVSVLDIEPVARAAAPSCSFSVSEAASAAPVHPHVQPLSIAVNESASSAPIHPDAQSLSIAVNESSSSAPVHPALQPLAVHVEQTASTAPVHPAVQPLSIAVNESSSSAPIHPALQPLGLHVEQTASTAPVHPDVQPLSIAVNESASSAPVQPTLQPLAVHVEQTASTAPVHPDVQPLSIEVVESASSAPVQPTLQPLALHVEQTASTAPVHPDVQPLSISVNESASSAPIQPTLRPFSLHVEQTASASPIQPTLHPLSLHVEQTASAAPIHPDAQPLGIHVEEATSTTPVKPAVASSTIDVNEAASVTPIERQTVPLTISTPQHTTLHTTPITPAQPELTINMLDSATLNIPPNDPETLDQELTINMLESAGLNISPNDVEIPRHELTINMLESASLKVSPNDAEIPRQELTINMLESASLNVSPNDVEIPKPTPINTQPTPPPTIITLHAKPSLFTRATPYIFALVALWAAHIYMRLHAWESANGLGALSPGDSYHDAGAFGNGRHFLGFPVAMHIGNSDFSEWLAGCLSTLISSIDGWNGGASAVYY